MASQILAFKCSIVFAISKPPNTKNLSIKEIDTENETTANSIRDNVEIIHKIITIRYKGRRN